MNEMIPHGAARGRASDGRPRSSAPEKVVRECPTTGLGESDEHGQRARTERRAVTSPRSQRCAPVSSGRRRCQLCPGVEPCEKHQNHPCFSFTIHNKCYLYVRVCAC